MRKRNSANIESVCHPFGRMLDSGYLVSIASFHFLPWLFPFATFAPLR